MCIWGDVWEKNACFLFRSITYSKRMKIGVRELIGNLSWDLDQIDPNQLFGLR